jgi:phosphoethanolamine N-methyltransferase
MEETREVMSSYWAEHSKKQSIEEMMLDEDACKITQHEHPEVMSLLPDLKGKTVLELGAGIG